MNDKIERLSKLIQSMYLSEFNHHDANRLAEALFEKGWIHHSDAVNYVEYCGHCDKGIYKHSDTPKPCPKCNGLLVVLKGAN